jgi:hypothetical protein
MLRLLDLRRVFAHLLVGAGFACGSAAPIGVGTDITPVEPSGGTSEDDIVDEPEGSGQMDPLTGVDGLIDTNFDRNGVSEHCRTSFAACGGLLAGTWTVEGNCNPEIRARDVLARWGANSMGLSPGVCYTAVQRLVWNWSGEFRFENGIAIDDRSREQVVDVKLDSACLNASFGMQEGASVSPDACDRMQDAFTTCALADGVCNCTNRTMANGLASGYYEVLGVSVNIAQAPETRYEYCVNGDQLLWREKEGDQRQVVLRRTVDAPAGAVDPVDIPR